MPPLLIMNYIIIRLSQTFSTVLLPLLYDFCQFFFFFFWLQDRYVLFILTIQIKDKVPHASEMGPPLGWRSAFQNLGYTNLANSCSDLMFIGLMPETLTTHHSIKHQYNCFSTHGLQCVVNQSDSCQMLLFYWQALNVWSCSEINIHCSLHELTLWLWKYVIYRVTGYFLHLKIFVNRFLFLICPGLKNMLSFTLIGCDMIGENYSWGHKFTHALQNLQNFNHLKKKEGS